MAAQRATGRVLSGHVAELPRHKPTAKAVAATTAVASVTAKLSANRQNVQKTSSPANIPAVQSVQQ